jgi:lipid-binding SYLF domain-containing protein
MEGGSIGFQIGGSVSDVVLLVTNKSGTKHLLSDKFTLGGDASAGAGPVGRDATAQTDAELHTEMLSYSRSRGVFSGVSLEGVTLRPDSDTNQELYGRDVSNREILSGKVNATGSSAKFEGILNRTLSPRIK